MGVVAYNRYFFCTAAVTVGQPTMKSFSIFDFSHSGTYGLGWTTLNRQAGDEEELLTHESNPINL